LPLSGCSHEGFPVAGDFDGDGRDDVAIHRDGTWQIRYADDGATTTVSFGSGSWPQTVPVARDWDADGTDTVGVRNATTWSLNDENDDSAPDVTFEYGRQRPAGELDARPRLTGARRRRGCARQVSAPAPRGIRARMDELSQKPAEPHDYAAVNVVWAAMTAALLGATARGAKPGPAGAELPIFGLATFTVTKALAKEKVGVWAREPLVENGSDGDHRPRGRGVRYVLGELVTCPRCLGTWSSLGLIGLRVARPREGRIVAGILATAAINDILQSAFTLLCATANATQSGAEVVESQARRIQAVEPASSARR
jgi:hypothetical protein